MQNYQVAVSNGNEKMKYYLSAGYLDEKGILDISYYKRYNFRVNLENQIRSWLTVSANISYSDYTSNGGGAMGTGANRGGVVLAVINTPTYAPIWDALNPNQYYNNFYGVGNITNRWRTWHVQRIIKIRKTVCWHRATCCLPCCRS